MSFGSARSIGKSATLLLIIGVIIAPIIAFSTIFLRFAYPSVLLISIALGVLSFVGSILFLVAMYRFANLYRTPAIFRNSLYGFLSSIVGGIVLTALIFGFLFSALAPLTPPFYTSPPVPSVVWSFFGLLAILWLGVFTIVLIQSIFYRAAYYALAEKSGEDNFRTAGLLMIIGGALTIIMVGALVFFVGWIFAAIGFFSMKSSSPQSSMPSQQPPMPQATLPAQKICQNCGAQNSESALYCSHCGAKL